MEKIGWESINIHFKREKSVFLLKFNDTRLFISFSLNIALFILKKIIDLLKLLFCNYYLKNSWVSNEKHIFKRLFNFIIGIMHRHKTNLVSFNWDVA